MKKTKKEKNYLSNQWLCYSCILLAGLSIIGFAFFNTLLGAIHWGNIYFTSHIDWNAMATNENILLTVSFIFILLATMFNFMAIIFKGRPYVFATIYTLCLFCLCNISFENVLLTAILLIVLILGYKGEK